MPVHNPCRGLEANRTIKHHHISVSAAHLLLRSILAAAVVIICSFCDAPSFVSASMASPSPALMNDTTTITFGYLRMSGIDLDSVLAGFYATIHHANEVRSINDHTTLALDVVTVPCGTFTACQEALVDPVQYDAYIRPFLETSMRAYTAVLYPNYLLADLVIEHSTFVENITSGGGQAQQVTRKIPVLDPLTLRKKYSTEAGHENIITFEQNIEAELAHVFKYMQQGSPIGCAYSGILYEDFSEYTAYIPYVQSLFEQGGLPIPPIFNYATASTAETTAFFGDSPLRRCFVCLLTHATVKSRTELYVHTDYDGRFIAATLGNLQAYDRQLEADRVAAGAPKPAWALVNRYENFSAVELEALREVEKMESYGSAMGFFGLSAFGAADWTDELTGTALVWSGTYFLQWSPPYKASDADSEAPTALRASRNMRSHLQRWVAELEEAQANPSDHTATHPELNMTELRRHLRTRTADATNATGHSVSVLLPTARADDGSLRGHLLMQYLIDNVRATLADTYTEREAYYALADGEAANSSASSSAVGNVLVASKFWPYLIDTIYGTTRRVGGFPFTGTMAKECPPISGILTNECYCSSPTRTSFLMLINGTTGVPFPIMDDVSLGQDGVASRQYAECRPATTSRSFPITYVFFSTPAGDAENANGAWWSSSSSNNGSAYAYTNTQDMISDVFSNVARDHNFADVVPARPHRFSSVALSDNLTMATAMKAVVPRYNPFIILGSTTEVVKETTYLTFFPTFSPMLLEDPPLSFADPEAVLAALESFEASEGSGGGGVSGADTNSDYSPAELRLLSQAMSTGSGLTANSSVFQPWNRNLLQLLPSLADFVHTLVSYYADSSESASGTGGGAFTSFHALATSEAEAQLIAKSMATFGVDYPAASVVVSSDPEVWGLAVRTWLGGVSAADVGSSNTHAIPFILAAAATNPNKVLEAAAAGVVASSAGGGGRLAVAAPAHVCEGIKNQFTLIGDRDIIMASVVADWWMRPMVATITSQSVVKYADSPVFWYAKTASDITAQLTQRVLYDYATSAADILYEQLNIVPVSGASFGPFSDAACSISQVLSNDRARTCQCPKGPRTFSVVSLQDWQRQRSSTRTRLYSYAMSTTCGVVYSPYVPPASPVDSLSTGAVVGLVVGCVAGFLVLVGGPLVLYGVYFGPARNSRHAPKDPTKPFAMVFTDIQASTMLWARAPMAMSEAVDLHHRILRKALARYSGYEVKTIGDSFMIAFKEAEDAVLFSVEAQKALYACDEWNSEINACYVEMMAEAEAEAAASRAGFNDGDDDDGTTDNATGGHPVKSPSAASSFPQFIQIHGATSRTTGRDGEVAKGLGSDSNTFMRTGGVGLPAPRPIILSTSGSEDFTSDNEGRHHLHLRHPGSVHGQNCSPNVANIAPPSSSPAVRGGSAYSHVSTIYDAPADGNHTPRGHDVASKAAAEEDALSSTTKNNNDNRNAPTGNHPSLRPAAGVGRGTTSQLGITSLGRSTDGAARAPSIASAAALHNNDPDNLVVLLTAPTNAGAGHGQRHVRRRPNASNSIADDAEGAAGRSSNRAGPARNHRDHHHGGSLVHHHHDDGGRSTKSVWNGIRVRIGVHYGFGEIRKDPVSLRYDYYGTVVNTAARVEGVGHGGQVLLTQDVIDALPPTFMADKGCDGRLLATVVPTTPLPPPPAPRGSRARSLNALITANADKGQHHHAGGGGALVGGRGAVPLFATTDLGPQPLRGLDAPITLVQLVPTVMAGRRFPPLRLHIALEDADINANGQGDDDETDTTLDSAQKRTNDGTGTGGGDAAGPQLPLSPTEMAAHLCRTAKALRNSGVAVESLTLCYAVLTTLLGPTKPKWQEATLGKLGEAWGMGSTVGDALVKASGQPMLAAGGPPPPPPKGGRKGIELTNLKTRVLMLLMGRVAKSMKAIHSSSAAHGAPVSGGGDGATSRDQAGGSDGIASSPVEHLGTDSASPPPNANTIVML